MRNRTKVMRISDDPEMQRKEAMQRAMRLLLYRDRSEWELRTRLTEDGFSEEAVENAMAYVASYGYINDKRFAENYVISRSKGQSMRSTANELRKKGVGEECIRNAFEENPIEEEKIIEALVKKRLGEPHIPDEKEKRRVFGFLARRGFASSKIMYALRRYENMSSSSQSL